MNSESYLILLMADVCHSLFTDHACKVNCENISPEENAALEKNQETVNQRPLTKTKHYRGDPKSSSVYTVFLAHQRSRLGLWHLVPD